MLSPIALLTLINISVLLLGGFMTLLAYRAYQRTMESRLGALALGMALITTGTVVGGILHQVFEMELIAGVIVQNLGVTAGFLILIYSLLSPTQTRRPSSPTGNRWTDSQG